MGLRKEGGRRGRGEGDRETRANQSLPNLVRMSARSVVRARIAMISLATVMSN